MVQEESWTEPFSMTVPAGQTAYKEKTWPYDGRIYSITLFFPTGSAATTSVYLWVEGEQAWPGSDSVAKDAASQDYRVSIEIHRGDRVRFYGTNTDTSSHIVSAEVTASIYAAVITKHPKIQPTSISALAYDLAIAEAAIKKGLGYLPVRLTDLL